MTLFLLCLMLARHVPEGTSLLCVLAALGMWPRQRSPHIPSHLPVKLWCAQDWMPLWTPGDVSSSP